MHRKRLIWQLYPSQLPITIIALLVAAGYGTSGPLVQCSGPPDLPAQHTAPPSDLFFERAFYKRGNCGSF